jgi:hypothetical protein
MGNKNTNSLQKSFLRRQHSLSYSRISHFTEPKGSLLHSQQPSTSVMSQMNPVHTTTSYLSEIHFKIILHPMVYFQRLFDNEIMSAINKIYEQTFTVLKGGNQFHENLTPIMPGSLQFVETVQNL